MKHGAREGRRTHSRTWYINKRANVGMEKWLSIFSIESSVVSLFVRVRRKTDFQSRLQVFLPALIVSIVMYYSFIFIFSFRFNVLTFYLHLFTVYHWRCRCHLRRSHIKIKYEIIVYDGFIYFFSFSLLSCYSSLFLSLSPFLCLYYCYWHFKLGE